MLLDNRLVYKPIMYPFALAAFDKHEKMHWVSTEITLNKDVEQWETSLSPGQKEFLTQLFRFFTQADIDVAKGYNQIFIPLLGGQPEVAMMMSSFAAREATHIAAYALLVDTLGLPEGEFSAFMQYKAMREKHEYLEEFKTDSHLNVAKSLAVYSAFTEGMQLFSTFAMLMHFERLGFMPGMTNIVRWSLRDEATHAESMIALYKVFRQEYIAKSEWPLLERHIHEVCAKMVELEDAFIDMAFDAANHELNVGLPDYEEPITKDAVKQYIKHTADYRLKALGCAPLYGEPENPLKWLDRLLLATEHTNFFESKPTEYSKGNIEYDDGGY